MFQNGLKDLDWRVFRFIRTSTIKEGSSPARAEIRKAMGYNSASAIEDSLSRLQIAGLIELTDKKARSIRLIQRGLPLEGYIAAGQPIEKDSVPGRRIKVGLEFEEEENFVLIVKGKSMIDEGINDRDHIIVKRQITCENGQIVVASHIIDPFEATLKKFRPKGDSVYLHPANTDMEPICIPKEEWNREWQIQGIVIFSFHFHERRVLESLGWYE
jgi:repressor LexA